MTVRQERINSYLVEQISDIISRMKDPRLGFVTVTGARVTSDLTIAHINVSVLGESDERKATLKALTDAQGYIRNQVGRNAHMRIIPTLHFHLDEGALHSARVLELLKKIEHEQADEPES